MTRHHRDQLDRLARRRARAQRSRTRADRGLARLVDAPVSGGEEGAVDLGPRNAGQVAKACNQMIVAATVLALGEASVVAVRAGLDVAAKRDLLGGGYADSRVLEVKKHPFATHDHSPSGPAKFMGKDLGFATDEARRSGTATPQLDVLRRVFSDLTAHGLGEQDTGVVQAYLEGLTRGA